LPDSNLFANLNQQLKGIVDMEKCTFVNFMKALEPWLNDDYIQHARVAGFARNQWPESIGIGGRNRAEYAFKCSIAT
jgi:hypothetical protein